MVRLKKRKPKNQYKKVIKASILRIVIILIFVGLNWTGFSAVGKTSAYFNDTESSNLNSCQSGALDFSLNAPGDSSLNFTPYKAAVRNIWVIDQGSLLF